MGRSEEILAGCIGSALADLVGGFPLWIGPTLMIRFLMADEMLHPANMSYEHRIRCIQDLAASVFRLDAV